MFKVRESFGGDFWIMDENSQYLHSDGNIYMTIELWPLRRQAQAVLDKFYPKHVWTHGDVFNNPVGQWIYTVKKGEESVFHLYDRDRGGTPAFQLRGATFLFNIKDKL